MSDDGVCLSLIAQNETRKILSKTKVSDSASIVAGISTTAQVELFESTQVTSEAVEDDNYLQPEPTEGPLAQTELATGSSDYLKAFTHTTITTTSPPSVPLDSQANFYRNVSFGLALLLIAVVGAAVCAIRKYPESLKAAAADLTKFRTLVEQENEKVQEREALTQNNLSA